MYAFSENSTPELYYTRSEKFKLLEQFTAYTQSDKNSNDGSLV